MTVARTIGGEACGFEPLHRGLFMDKWCFGRRSRPISEQVIATCTYLQRRSRRATSPCGGRRAVDRLESGREVPKKRRLLDDAVAAKLFPVLVHLNHHFDHVVDVAPRVDASWDRQAHELELNRPGFPEAPDLERIEPSKGQGGIRGKSASRSCISCSTTSASTNPSERRSPPSPPSSA